MSESPPSNGAADRGSARDPVIEGARCPSCGALLAPDEGGACIACRLSPPPGGTGPAPGGDDRGEGGTDGPGAADPVRPLAEPADWDVWLPQSVLLVSLLVLMIGYLAGNEGLYQSMPPEESIGLWTRLTMVARIPLQVLIWCGCGITALFALSWLHARPLGPAGIIGWRMLASSALCLLAGFMSIDTPVLETALPTALQILIGFAGVSVFFRLRPREAALMILLTGAAFGCLILLVSLVRFGALSHA